MKFKNNSIYIKKIKHLEKKILNKCKIYILKTMKHFFFIERN